MPSVSSGVCLGDRYRIESLLATGGMGEVWSARDTVLQRTVAVKALRPGALPDPAAAERLRAEARAAAMLSCERVVNIHDAGEFVDADGRTVPYLVMELVPGQPLNQVLREQGPLSEQRTIQVLSQVAEALVAAHTVGLVHRDIKPANILMLPTGDCKVVDFGISHHAGSTGMTATGLMVGTARYLSPEQVAGERATAASDIYSLGVVGHEALRGQPMYDGDSDIGVALAHVQQSPPPLPATVSPALVAVITSMLAKEPAARPTAQQVLTALGTGTSVAAVTGPATSPTIAVPSQRDTTAIALVVRRPVPGRRRVPGWALATAGLTSAAGVALALILLQGSPARPAGTEPAASLPTHPAATTVVKPSTQPRAVVQPTTVARVVPAAKTTTPQRSAAASASAPVVHKAPVHTKKAHTKHAGKK